MVDPAEFMSMEPGIPFAVKVHNVWIHQVDDAFVVWVVANAAKMDQYKLRHALVLVQDRDLPELRKIMMKYVGHEDPGYWVAARSFFENQFEHGYISEVPTKRG